MHKHLFAIVFWIGVLAVVWVGGGFVGSNLLALAMTIVIGAVYLLGAQEIRQFRRATATLMTALENIPTPLPRLGDWLKQLDPSLQNAVRLRIAGERMGLPGLALTPYLVGLLVMLGMLGTFVGMVMTFNGAVFALEGTTDLAAIRAALAAPIKGLGLAFGTSVAGVAASAMLGLLSAMSRNERQRVAQLLDHQIATTALHEFTDAHQRHASLQALQAIQAQGEMLSPKWSQLIDQLQTLAGNIENRQQTLSEQLVRQQNEFHGQLRSIYGDLAQAVDESLHASLTRGVEAAGERIRPVMEAAVTRIAQDTRAQHERMLASADELMRARMAAETTWIAQQDERMEQLIHHLQRELGALRKEEAQRSDAAEVRLAQLQTDLTKTLGEQLATQLLTLGAGLEAPLTRLLDTAASAPQAAAQVIEQMREELTKGMARDNALLEERSHLLTTLETQLAAINQASTEQRSAIDALVAAAATTINQAAQQLAAQSERDNARLEALSVQMASSAVDVASLGEAFAGAAQGFANGNGDLAARLQQLQVALEKSMQRSDEQLAYYVAQARDIIELSVTAQKEIIEALQQVSRAAQAADGVR